ncbi:MAG TPA: hypothetical protein VM580_02250 [Labilithrix sp.]|nr:hypothetical protein [Labilithrix sp.]
MRRLRGLLALAAFSTLAWTTAPAAAADLAPPPPIGPLTVGAPNAAPGPAQAEMTQKLDEAEQKDSGRNFELFWVDATAGGSYIDMRQFASDSFQIDKASGGGPAFSLGAGARYLFFVGGLRARYQLMPSFDMWQINAEAGIKLPLHRFDILFGLHGGYAFVGRLDDAALTNHASTRASADDVSVRGFNAGLDFGFDYYITPLFSVGAGILGDFLYLNRPKVDKPAGFDTLPADQKAATEGDPLYQKSGNAAGLQLSGGLRLGLHFGL